MELGCLLPDSSIMADTVVLSQNRSPSLIFLIWSALFQTAISANLKIEFAMPSLEIMFWKRALRIYGHMHICEKLCYPKHNLWTGRWHSKSSFLFKLWMALIVFWKRACQILYYHSSFSIYEEYNYAYINGHNNHYYYHVLPSTLAHNIGYP